VFSISVFSFRYAQSRRCLEHIGLDGATTTADTTSAASGNETHLLAGWRVAADCGRVTNVLVVTTGVRVLNGVHAHTLDVRPAVSLGLVFPVRSACLEHGLVHATTARNHAHDATALALHQFLRARWQAQACLAGIGVVRNDGCVVTRRARQFAAVTRPGLHIGHDRTFRHRAEGQHVADLELRLLASVHELASEQTLHRDECRRHGFVFVWVTESNAGQRRTTSRIVDNLSHNTLDVAVAFGVVK